MTTRKPTVLNVTLDETTKPWTVLAPDVEIRKRTRLVWKLTGNAKGGTFPVIDHSYQAFYLHKPPPPDVFSNPQSSSQDTKFGLTVDPTVDPNKPDDWYYHLWVKLDHDHYQTAPPPPAKSRKTKSPNAKGQRASCPRIKNR